MNKKILVEKYQVIKESEKKMSKEEDKSVEDLEKDYKEVYSNSKFSIIIYKKGVE